jgi:hypothetical protein
MAHRQETLFGMLFCGVVAMIGGFVMLHMGRAADQQDSLIPFKHGTMSPSHAYAGGGLLLVFGIVLCVLWLTRWRRNNI